MLHFLKRHKEFLMIFIFILITVIINYFVGSRNLDEMELSKVSGYSFWEYSLSGGVSTVLLIIAPLLIIVACFLSFFNELKTGFIEYRILRIPYKKYFKKALGKCYIKSILLFPLLSLVIFMIGILIFGTEIHSGVGLIHFTSKQIPLLFVCFSMIGIILYGILSINIALILAKFFNKFYLVLISLFMSMFFVGYIEANYIFKVLAGIFSNSKLGNVSLFDLYFTTLSQPDWFLTIGLGLIRIMISGLVVYQLYKNQEGVILSNEK